MKHLKKKYVLHVKLNDDVVKVINNAPEHKKEVDEIMKNNLDGYYGLAFTENNDLVQTFKYEEDGKVFMIPEPDPVVIYFDSARHYYRQISGKREQIFEKVTKFDKHISATTGDFYWYFSLASSYAIFLYTSIEAFINKMIPNEYIYSRKIQDKRTELFDKPQIQRYLEFSEKLKNVLPEITGKNFVAEFTHKFEQIKKLKNFRDEIAHTKSYDGENGPNRYENLYVTSLNFDYEQTLNYVKDFINFYQPDLIEICPCENDN
jgi:hypothetical protein